MGRACSRILRWSIVDVMSYISIDSCSVADFTQVIISVWFRVPQQSVDSAAAAIGPGGDALSGIIPLVVMGTKGSKKEFHTQKTSVINATFTATGPNGGGGVVVTDTFG